MFCTISLFHILDRIISCCIEVIFCLTELIRCRNIATPHGLTILKEHFNNFLNLHKTAWKVKQMRSRNPYSVLKKKKILDHFPKVLKSILILEQGQDKLNVLTGRTKCLTENVAHEPGFPLNVKGIFWELKRKRHSMGVEAVYCNVAVI